MTPESMRLRELIRSGAVMPSSPFYNQFVAAIYEAERQAESLTVE
jgi:hypothetical protein